MVLARLLTPEDFGLLAIAWVVIELLLTLTDTGMVTALVQRDRVDESQFDTAWTVGIVRALVVAVVLVVGAPLIAQFFGSRERPASSPLAAAPVLAALASIKIADLTRNPVPEADFIRVPEAVVEAVVSIALATLLGVWALVVGVLVANLVRGGAVVPGGSAPAADLLDQGAARSPFRFGRWLFAVGVLGLAGEALLRAVIARRLGIAELGIFYLAMRLVMLPLTSVESAVGSIGMPLHARLQADPVRRTRPAHLAGRDARAAHPWICPAHRARPVTGQRGAGSPLGRRRAAHPCWPPLPRSAHRHGRVRAHGGGDRSSPARRRLGRRQAGAGRGAGVGPSPARPALSARRWPG